MEKSKQQLKITKFIDHMPSMSTTVGKVLQVCSKTNASPNELCKVISLDPVLTGQVLKLINSAYYSLVNQVTSLPRAITMLGMNTVKNMALSTAAIALVGHARKKSALSMEQFWVHSLGVAVAAKMFGGLQDLDLMQREELFFAGLLHDLGKIPFADDYLQVLELIEEKQIPLIEVEQEVFGITHQYVGEMIAQKWKFNSFLTDCISHHHDFDHRGCDERIALVSLADLYINCMGYGSAGNAYPDLQRRDELLVRLGFDWDQLVQMGENVLVEIERAKIFLQV
ncbi:HDOD domain-containing protein [Desulfotalea psychrophila]|uniref:HDOD domain-containing protein n=1 Tax=Desulfotalea psychrophila (strain LSv54 / DSM 12343) TaxID=177439 RepID=Q6ASD0_DESPS|nr:HDOD domain-containing protein [Desulfotalea psychrophila]CAG34733.1 conserved hypothetical protein [Desulfotalea psychrophila LSv54]